MVLGVAGVDLLAVNGGRVVNPRINARLVKGRPKVVRVFNQKAILVPSMLGSWSYVWKDDVVQFRKSGVVCCGNLTPSCQPPIQTLQLNTSNRGRNF